MAILNYIIIITGLLIGFIFFREFRFLPDGTPSENLSVSIIIPVRNEAHNISNLLKDLLSQNCKIKEIICVDDGSDDGSREIIRSFPVIYKRNEKLPEGWKGKSWACQTGASEASGDILIFIDADVRLAKDAIAALLYAHENTKLPISVQPYHVVKKPYEFISMFFNIIQTGATGMCMGKRIKATGMFGPVFLVSKSVFNSLNGYEKVKGETVEDFCLGKIYAKNDKRIELYLGGKLISFRMYPNGLSSLFEGWTKNFSKGAFAIRPWVLFLFIIWVTYITVLPIEIAFSIANGKYLILAILLALYIVSILSLKTISNFLGSYPLMCQIFFPLLMILFHLVFLYSFFAIYILKSTKWKGRKL